MFPVGYNLMHHVRQMEFILIAIKLLINAKKQTNVTWWWSVGNYGPVSEQKDER